MTDKLRLVCGLNDSNLKHPFFSKQIELVDMHFGTGLSHTTIDLDPYVVYDHLSEIRSCYRASRSVSFIVSKQIALLTEKPVIYYPSQQSLIGNSLGEFCLPTEIRTDVFNEIINLLTSDETELMKNCYKNDSNAGVHYLHTNFR